MPKWFEIIEAEAESKDVNAVELESLTNLAQVLDKFEASPSGGGHRYGVVLALEEESPHAALARGLTEFNQAREKLNLPNWPVVRCELLGDAEALRRAPSLEAREGFHAEEMTGFLSSEKWFELVGTREAVQTLGVTRQRFSKLLKQPEFPEPVAHLAATKVWLRSSIEGYGRVRNTSPGRPPVASWKRLEGPPQESTRSRHAELNR